jgi:hypothetical protein
MNFKKPSTEPILAVTGAVWLVSNGGLPSQAGETCPTEPSGRNGLEAFAAGETLPT